MSKIGKAGWFSLYAIAGLIDVGQILIDFTGIGAGINELVDPFIGIGFGIWFQIKGVSMFQRPSRIISLLGVTALEELTFGVAPAWIADIWYIHQTVKNEESARQKAEAEQKFKQSNTSRRYVENGVGRVRNEEAELDQSQEESYYIDGVGRPRGRVVLK